MERFIRKHFWLLSGAFILIAAPVAAGTMQLLTRHIPALAPEPNASAIVIERERITTPTQSSVTVDTSTAWGDIRTVSEHARVVVGADGLHTLEARHVRPEQYH
jgi:hypothetical protein